jgi:hypothetical protein
MRCCEISKEMSSLYFGLAVFCLFDARVPEFETQPSPPVQCTLNTASNYGTLGPEFLNIYWRLKSRLPVKSCLFTGQRVQQGLYRL